jgi:DnaJ-domain-containing protein 1
MKDRKRKKRASIWEENPYGTTTERGDPDVWRAAFGEAMSEPEAEAILGDDSPWGILGIKVGSAFAAVKTAWRGMAMKWHPDTSGIKGETALEAARQKFLQAKAAYVKLGGKA